MLVLKTTPKVLIVYLKRFTGGGGSGRVDKIDQHVSFPLEGLSLNDYCSSKEQEKYRLLSVIVHRFVALCLQNGAIALSTECNAVAGTWTLDTMCHTSGYACKRT